MSSYFVNSLFSKYKTGESLRPNYYDCGFAQDLGGRPTVVYGPSSGGSFQHPSQIQEFYHGPSSLSTAPYQQNPCAVACHGDPGNFYGYDPLQRQSLFGAQDPDLVQYADCKLAAASGLGEEAEGSEQSPSPTQLFPWMRPQGELPSDLDLTGWEGARGAPMPVGGGGLVGSPGVSSAPRGLVGSVPNTYLLSLLSHFLFFFFPFSFCFL
jgi:hypothetical protein